MGIKHLILLVSIFYLLHGSSSTISSTSSYSNNNDSLETPDVNISSTLESSDESSSTLDAPDESSSTMDAPDESSSTMDAPDESSLTLDAPDESSSTLDAPDESSWTPESPDESLWTEPQEGTPVSPYFGAVDLTPEAPGPSVTFSFTLMPGSGNPELEKICKATELPINCMTILSQFLNDSIQIDPLTVAKVGIEMSSNMSRQAIATATKFQNDPEASTGLKEALSVCIENYDTIPDDNDGALQALDRQDISEASIKLSASLASIETCLDGNRQMHNLSPMRDMDSELKTLIRINLNIVADLIKF
ncbi:hypothetical protein V6N13_128365 [Hibiscus sabdariffa]|uniref:Pectinesterase inhibitor domain-containing protein n=1 Tax=Hibiscus sabdariffa TaxID=183260 RepID=A0ABR2P183_9ROSI